MFLTMRHSPCLCRKTTYIRKIQQHQVWGRTVFVLLHLKTVEGCESDRTVIHSPLICRSTVRKVPSNRRLFCDMSEQSTGSYKGLTLGSAPTNKTEAVSPTEYGAEFTSVNTCPKLCPIGAASNTTPVYQHRYCR